MQRFAGRGVTAAGAVIAVFALQTVTATAAPAGSTSLAPATPSSPALKVVALQRDGDSGPFARKVISISENDGQPVGHTIEYKIRVSNTGSVPLTLSLDDPGCDAGTMQGPSPVRGTLTGEVLAPGDVAQYTCSHLLRSDPATFTNTATVAGAPASGPSVQGTSSVTVKQHSLGALRVCRTSSGRTIRYHGVRPPAACGLTRRHH